jgi:Kef-type K+ transport system membrane component KefB
MLMLTLAAAAVAFILVVFLPTCSMLKDLKDMETLSKLGVLFLLYEQGLELSLDRLKVGFGPWGLRVQGAGVV